MTHVFLNKAFSGLKEQSFVLFCFINALLQAFIHLLFLWSWSNSEPYAFQANTLVLSSASALGVPSLNT